MIPVIVTIVGAVLASSTFTARATETMVLSLYTEEYPPFNYTRNQNIIGTNTELIQAVLNDLGFNAKLEVVPWGRAQRFTQTKLNTCFFSAVRSAERERLYQWVGPLSTEYIQLFSLDPEFPKLNSFSEASKLKIGGQVADAYTDFGASQGLSIDRVAEIPINLYRLELGWIELWLAGSIGGPFIASGRGLHLHPVATSDHSFELWMACNLEMSASIIHLLNTSLHRKQVDGTFDNILARYRKAIKISP